MKQRGLSDSDLDRCQYRTLPANVPASIPLKLFQEFGEVVKRVPGIRPNRINGVPGTLIPCRDRHGRIVAIKSRADHIEPGQPRYTSLSSAKLKPAGPKAEAATHVPAGTPEQCDLVRVTEGEVKADVAFALSQIPTLGLPGVNSWRKALPIIAELEAKTVRLSFDADHRTTKSVAESLLRVAQELPRLGYDVEFETWPEASGKGIDNVLADGHAETITITRGREALAAIQANALALGIEIKGEAEPTATANREAHEVANATFETTTNDEGQEETKVVPLAVGEIVKRIYTTTDGWPRSCEGGLFVDDPKHGGISWLKNPAALFGYLGSVVGRINWYRTVGCVGKDELFAEVVRTAQRYRSIEHMPHYPPMPGAYYAIGSRESDYPNGNGNALRELLDRFSPATDIDRDLILSLLLTQFWGGEGGDRPVFAIMTQDGPGVGKTTVVKVCAELTGGVLGFERSEQVGEIKKRVLSDEARRKRIALIDNVRSDCFNWSELEGFITANEITGRKLYSGESARPNTLVWVLTTNDANLSPDMAQRTVVIEVKKPARSATWKRDTLAHVRQNQRAIVCDLLAILRAKAEPLASYSRWEAWEDAILSKMPEPSDAQRVIAERQQETDVESESDEIVREYFVQRLEALGYDPEAHRVLIPTSVVAQWYSAGSGTRGTPVGIARTIAGAIKRKRISWMTVHPSRTHGRNFVWEPESVGVKSLCTDLLLRQAEQAIERSRSGYS